MHVVSRQPGKVANLSVQLVTPLGVAFLQLNRLHESEVQALNGCGGCDGPDEELVHGCSGTPEMHPAGFLSSVDHCRSTSLLRSMLKYAQSSQACSGVGIFCSFQLLTGKQVACCQSRKALDRKVGRGGGRDLGLRGVRGNFSMVKALLGTQ